MKSIEEENDANDMDIALTMWLRLVTCLLQPTKRVLTNELHVLQPLLPDITNFTFNLRSRYHNKQSIITRAHHRDEKPERDMTYHLICLFIYH